jgi:uncharacterized membrane protein
MTKNWHQVSQEKSPIGGIIADKTASVIGSWGFVIGLTIFIVLWVTLNIIGFVQHWDVYPFVLLNLFFSAQATYSAPLIMMSQNRAADRDRHQAEEDYRVNREAKEEIESLQIAIGRVEDTHLKEISEKLDKILKKR